MASRGLSILLLCCAQFTVSSVSSPPPDLAPRAYKPLPYGSVAPQGWLLSQLVRQANALAGVMSKSTFPGADTVNSSLWIGGSGKAHYGTGTTQWLPYWTNGMVPLIEQIRAAGAEDQLDPSLNIIDIVDEVVDYVLAHTNKTKGTPGYGWIGPFLNEPGDKNGHGLWDPLNMLRTLLNYAEGHPDRRREIAAAAVAHMTKEAELLKTDPVIVWASTRWPTYVEIAQYIVDEYVDKYSGDKDVLPLGAAATKALMLSSSVMFKAKGMDWKSYYHQEGQHKFPEGPVQGWNSIDHGVNNAEGAIRWPAAAFRMSGGDPAVREEMAVTLHMLDTYQGQVQSLFCADEVFCGRAPHRGTETCAVVEAMASLEYAYAVLGDESANIMDRVERLAFNAMPAALTADMWTHVYVQQANSVFAGNSYPKDAEPETPAYWDPSRRHHKLHYQHTSTSQVGDTPSPEDQTQVGDTPSGEDQTANFYGVSHFPCCITNFPQGWPKFAQHAYLVDDNLAAPALLVASLVPSKASYSLTGGQYVTVETQSKYPFGDDATVTFNVTGKKGVVLKIRVPGWAVAATIDGIPVKNGSTWASKPLQGVLQVKIALNPAVRAEFGWGDHGFKAGSPVTIANAGATSATGAPVPTSNAALNREKTPASDLALSSGASVAGSRQSGHQDLRSGLPGHNATALVMHALGGTTPDGKGHHIIGAEITFRYVAGYTPGAGQTKKGSQVALVLVLADDPDTEVQTLALSEPLDKWSFDNYKGYSPPVTLKTTATIRVPDAPKRLLLLVKIINNERNLYIQLDPKTGLNAAVRWDAAGSFSFAGPHTPPSEYLVPPRNSVAVLRGPLVFALHPQEDKVVVKDYCDHKPARKQAVDYAISTTDDWNYALLTGSKDSDWTSFDGQASAGWSPELAFDDSGDYPFSIGVKARTVEEWGFWSGTKITGNLPPSPYNKTTGLGPVTTLRLVPFGSTNIRIAVFPWIPTSKTDDKVESREV